MWLVVFGSLPAVASEPGGSTAEGVPQNVEQLWANVDPGKEPLEVEVVREWEEEGGVFRYVVYTIGTFKGVKARMAAFYGFPKEGRQLPAVMHMHGGGQRAMLHVVKYYVGRGYACLSVNWGGRPMEDAKPGEPNTDWGAVDPTQNNVPGYFNLLPGAKFLDPAESPRNCNWYLLTLGCRRGLTFLESQPEVDRGRLGVFGHSMGGNLTTYVAGTDRRVKVAAASVGGQGFRTFGSPYYEEQVHLPRGDLELFRRTMGYQHYAPRIRCPYLHLGATNDFHGIMDDVYRTLALVPHDEVRCVFAAHLNHRFTPSEAITRPLWLDQHLKGTFVFPETPKSRLDLDAPGGIPRLLVEPDGSKPVASVRIYYAVDPDPRARFWRSAVVERGGDTWQAELPLLDTDFPLFAFANVEYELDQPDRAPQTAPTSTFSLSSLLHIASPEELRSAGVRAADGPSLVIDDFGRGMIDWYVLNPGNPHHWEYWTRKITDPKWHGPEGAELRVDLVVPQDNTLVIVAQENEWRRYRGRRRTYVAQKQLAGSGQVRCVGLGLDDFECPDDGAKLARWDQLDQLALCPYYNVEGRGSESSARIGGDRWKGEPPRLVRLQWAMPAAETKADNE